MEKGGNIKTSMVGSCEVSTISINVDNNSVHKANTSFWNTVGSDVLGTTALPFYGAFVSEEKGQLFGDVLNKNVLEIGCGNGKSLEYIGERRANELWGIDIS